MTLSAIYIRLKRVPVSNVAATNAQKEIDFFRLAVQTQTFENLTYFF